MPHDDSLLEDFCLLILDKMGLRFTKDNQKELERKLTLMSEELGFQNNHDCLTWFLDSPFNQKKMALLVEHLTIGETYFFRDAHAFEMIKKKILPDLLQLRKKKQQLWIWSAGCCTGEEIYSLAILLDQLLPSSNSWSIHLIGTDINPAFLQRAQLGRYREWALRNTPEAIKRTYFTKEGDLFTLLPSIREKVEFYVHNLIDPSFPFLNQIDLILCHNVIIYLAPSPIQKVVQKLAYALNEKGWLSVSSIEVPYILDPSLLSLSLEEVAFFEKKANSFTLSSQDSLLHPLSNPLLFPEPPLFPLTFKINSDISLDDQQKDKFPALEKKSNAQVLRARAQQLRHPLHIQEKREPLQVVVFYLNQEKYAIEFKYIGEVYPFKECTSLPNLPPFMKGIMNRRRKILSIIDLKSFFGLSDEYQPSHSPVIILEEQQKEFGILTDGVEGVREIFLEDIQSTLPTLTGIKQEFLKGFTADHLLILDGKKLLEDDRLVIRDNFS